MNQTVKLAKQLLDLYNAHREIIRRSAWIDHALDLAGQIVAGTLKPNARNHEPIYRAVVTLQGQIDHATEA